MITNLIQAIIDILAGICSLIANVFPSSPFNALNSIVLDSSIMQFIAWLVPFPQIISLLEAWIACIAIYYAQMIIMRWVKLLS